MSHFIALPSDPATKMTDAQLAAVASLFDAHGGEAFKRHLIQLVHTDERTAYGLADVGETVFLFDGGGRAGRAHPVESEDLADGYTTTDKRNNR
jgi:hypothetical protein